MQSWGIPFGLQQILGMETIPVSRNADNTPKAHCINSLRLSLQCHKDLSLIPFRWADGWIEPWPIFSNKHQCRDFDAIRDWAKENGPSLVGTLEHPELGTVGKSPLNVSALLIWNEPHDQGVKPGKMPVHSHLQQNLEAT
jgi:hypothetical protein